MKTDKRKRELNIRNGKPPRAGMGRPKGVPNKLTKSVKDSLMEALNSGDGATAFWEKLKTDDPRTYAACVVKLIPLQVQQELNSKVDSTVTIKFENMESTDA